MKVNKSTPKTKHKSAPKETVKEKKWAGGGASKHG